ncbi:cellulose synthase complex periplasmic endoglucanase BcsZ [Pigmentiphaga soli]|uniref:Glucanase n=1 Tax=Pigmentiphaga soli TaxID=1007095 RepID=A0ABP8GR96_9BURK
MSRAGLHPRLPALAVRRRLLKLCGALPLALGLGAANAAGAAACPAEDWPLYQTFLQRFVQADGRVVDFSVAQLQTTSEGQSYGMLFALVANDPATFGRLWQWSVANLAGGDVASRLPAWQWGRRPDGSWGVLDPNAASDADLWMAYALLEAARLWRRPEYAQNARTLMARIALDEVADLPGLGKMLLPGPTGFAHPDMLWRLNPSYAPIPLLRRLAQEDPQGPWQAIAANTARMIAQVSPQGYAADWVAYKSPDGATGAFVADPEKGDLGSYDAIRVYMWAGMMPPSDPLAGPLLKTLSGMVGATAPTGLPPEKVQVLSGAVSGVGPVGFSAALLPYFQRSGQTRLYEQQRQRVQTQLIAPAGPAQPPYYDYVLGLFGSGWAEQRYRFLPSGRLQSRWEKACPRATTR